MKKIIIVALFTILGWMFCGSIIGIGRTLTTMEIILLIHLVGVPIIFGIISIIYFYFFNYTTPLLTAAIFTGTAIILDFFLVAIFIEKSFDMFKSAIGTWIPFGFIFITTYYTGSITLKIKNK